MGQRNFDLSATKKAKGAKISVSKTKGTNNADNKSVELKNNIKLNSKLPLKGKSSPLKTDYSKLKRTLPSEQKTKAIEKPTQQARERSVLKKAPLAKEIPVYLNQKKLEHSQPLYNNFLRRNVGNNMNAVIKDKSSTDSEFKRKFESIVQKNTKESKISTNALQKSVEKTPKTVISNFKSKVKPTLQIETWGPAHAPKPLFNLSKALMRSTNNNNNNNNQNNNKNININNVNNVNNMSNMNNKNNNGNNNKNTITNSIQVEKKLVSEKNLIRSENLIKRLSKEVPSIGKQNGTKVWKF